MRRSNHRRRRLTVEVYVARFARRTFTRLRAMTVGAAIGAASTPSYAAGAVLPTITGAWMAPSIPSQPTSVFRTVGSVARPRVRRPLPRVLLEDGVETEFG